MIKSILKRLKGASGAGARKTVRAGTKQTVRSARQTARTRAARAARTTVQTNPRVGTKAVLKGKEVYWGGKDYGWQSKASLTKITNGKKKAATKASKSSTYPVGKSDKSPLVGRARAKAAEKSRRRQLTSKDSGPSQGLKNNNEAATKAATRNTETNKSGAPKKMEYQTTGTKSGVIKGRRPSTTRTAPASNKNLDIAGNEKSTGIKPKPTKQTVTGSLRSTNTKSGNKLKGEVKQNSRSTGSKDKPKTRAQQRAQAVKDADLQRVVPKTPVTSSQRLTAKQRQRRLTTKNRDIGAKAAAARIDATKGGASVARGDIKSTSRGASKPTTLKETASRASNQRRIEARRGKELGNDADKGRQVRLSAADARAAADQYEIDRMKEITKASRSMTGRAASDYVKKAKKEMKRQAASIRQNARSRSLTSRRSGKNNASPSHASQNPKDLKGNASSRRSLRDTQKEGERLSADMDRRKAAGQLKEIDKTPSKPRNPASTGKGVKKGKPLPTGRPTPNSSLPPKVDPTKASSKPKKTTKKKVDADQTRGPKGPASDRSVITDKNSRQTVKERESMSALRRRNRTSSKPSTAAQRRAVQRAEGSTRVRGRDANERARLRENSNKSSTTSGRSKGATTDAQQAVAATRKRQAVRDAANKVLQKDFMSNF